MPVMDGIQATKEIRRIEKLNAGFPSTPQSEGQRTPSDGASTTSASDSRTVSTPAYRSSVIIVALTASSLQADRVAALAAGCNDFLTKPVSLDWLNSKIIEWGSIKALQMWAEIRPEVVKSIATGQAQQAQQVARRLHVPEGRSTTPGAGGEKERNRSGSVRRRARGESGAAKNPGQVVAAEKPTSGAVPHDGAAATGLGITIGSEAPVQSSNTLANIAGRFSYCSMRINFSDTIFQPWRLPCLLLLTVRTDLTSPVSSTVTTCRSSRPYTRLRSQ